MSITTDPKPKFKKKRKKVKKEEQIKKKAYKKPKWLESDIEYK